MKFIWNKIKLGFKQLKTSLKENWQLVVGFLIYYIVPIGLISEKLAYTQEVKGGIKLAVGGIIALVALFLVFHKKLKEYVVKMNKGAVRGVFRIIMSAIYWGVIFGLVFVMKTLGTYMVDFWLKVGVCFAVGHIFYMWDELKSAKELEEE